jgi:rhodanese-related sulfurtransferase
MRTRFAFIVLGLLVAMPVLAYDAELAQRFAQFYQPFGGKTCAKSLQMIKPEDFVKEMSSETAPFVLDVRTEKEAALLGITAEDSLTVPMQQVFLEETLHKLPQDRKIVVVCKGGHRATAVAMGLRQIGFENVFILKGGFAKLAGFLTPKAAYMPLK